MEHSTGIIHICALYLLIVVINTLAAHEWNEKSTEQFQAGHLYNNETIKSHESTKNIEEIRQLKSNLAQISVFKSQIVYEDIAIFIGATKSGKSTLINYLLGNKLIGIKEPLSSIFVKKIDDRPGPEIGTQLTSETSIPTRWKSSKILTELALWDSPGFEDNRGPAQDITNAFYIKELFKNVKSAKIILVSDINDILSGRINPFLSLLNSIEQIFNEKFKDYFSNIVLVLTKVPSDFDGESLTVDYISKYLKQKILPNSSIKISDFGKEFLHHLSLNTNQIAFFKKAEVGPISKSLVNDIIKAIISIDGIKRENLIEVSPSISLESKVFLFEIRHDLTSSFSLVQLNHVIHKEFEELLNNLSEKINDNPTIGDLKAIQQELLDLQNKIKIMIESKTSFPEKIDLLQTMNPVLQQKINADNLVEKSKIKGFIDELLKLKESDIFNVHLRAIMQYVNYNIKIVLVEIRLLLREINKKEADIEFENYRNQAVAELHIAKQEYENFTNENNKVRSFFGFIADALDHFLKGSQRYLSAIWKFLTSEESSDLAI